MLKHSSVVIVGCGHAGAQVASTLRQLGHADTITMVGKEMEPPYERPPLSKHYLAGTKEFERILMRSDTFWEEQDITIGKGRVVSFVDPVKKCVGFQDGGKIGYDKLVWAAGGTPRQLVCAGAELRGIHPIRDKADTDRIRSCLAAGARRVVVVGGGYVGLEAAAVLSQLGCEITIVEALDRVLARVAGEELSRFLEAEHRAHGVTLLLDSQVAAFEGDGTTVSGVRLRDGTLLPCELVIVGIGIEPAIAPLAASGAGVSNGLEVDEYCRTNLPDIYAIGDCAVHRNKFADDALVRLESVQNATDMAKTAAKAVCGTLEPYDVTPWFWSDQYDLRLQTVGLSTGHDATVVRGDPVTRSFAVVYMKAGRVIALDCINATKDYMLGRKLVEARKSISMTALADTEVPLSVHL